MPTVARLDIWAAFRSREAEHLRAIGTVVKRGKQLSAKETTDAGVSVR